MTAQTDAEPISIEEAFGRAVAESEGEASPDIIPAEESVEALEAAVAEDAPESTDGQPDESQESTTAEDDTDIFAELDEGAEGDQPDVFAEIAAMVTPDDADAPTDLDALKEAIQAQKDGYLRQADYTRKTQALADERRAFETDSQAAKKLWDEVNRDPAATIAYLAEQVGLVEKGTFGEKVKQLQDVWEPPLTGEAMEQEIENRVEQRLAEHPDIVAAQEQNIVTRVEQEFAAIESKYGVSLNEAARIRMLERAAEAGTSDLDLIYNALQAELDQRRQRREAAAASATSRPGPRPDTEEDKPAKVETVEDAFDLAFDEMQAAA